MIRILYNYVEISPLNKQDSILNTLIEYQKMTVPDANGIDLLREHAFYEYGNREFQSVLDFDYYFALDQFVSHEVLNIKLIGILSLLFIIISPFIILLQRKRSKIITQTLIYDPEDPPQLSRSNTTTPTSSPDLSKDLFRIKTYRFDDYQSYKQA